MLSLEFVQKLCCPDCRGDFEFSLANLICKKCNRSFPVQQGVPFLFPISYKHPDVSRVRIRKKDKSTWEYFKLEDIIPAGISPDNEALDIGCGANPGKYLAGKGYIVTGFDIFPDENVKIVGDAHSIPFKNQSFNLVTCMSVFEHLSDPWKACREINRILKRGGHIACSMAFLEPYHGQSHFHFSHKGAKKLFVETGFKILKLLPLGFTYSEACLRELAPIPLLPSVSGFCVKNILRLRKIGIKFIASYYKKRDSGKYNRAVEYGEEDNFRFEAGFKILGIKS